MRKLAQIQDEVARVAHSIGVDSFECAKLNAKIQQISQRIQGSLARLDQLSSEQPEESSNVVSDINLPPEDAATPEPAPKE